MKYPSLAEMPALDILRLIRSENVGAVTFFHLIRRYKTAANALEALPELAARGGKKQISLYPKEKAEQELQQAIKFGANLLLYGDKNYPTLLHEIHDAPPLLMMLGSTTLWQNRRCIAMVGSRNASAAGCSLTRKLARECGELGFTVVSGLARGIDSAAHQGALSTGTIGIIAGGIDNIYPPENRPLYEQLAETGAIVSEQPFGSAPHSRSFPGRNRIIAGICEALLVVEATFKSGSLISAHYALEQGREVMAVPGSPLDPRSQGTNSLIKQGAVLIETAQDIFNAIQQSHLPGAFEMKEDLVEDYVFSPPVFSSTTEIEEAYKILLSRLSPVPVLLDEIARETQIPVALLQSLVLELELAGRLYRAPGGKLALNYNEAHASVKVS